MKNYIPHSNKSNTVVQLINEALDILNSVGIPLGNRTENNLQWLAMTFLTVSGVKKNWDEAQSFDTRNLTPKEIIKTINEDFDESRSPGSYDAIRDNFLTLLVEKNLIVNRGISPSASKYAGNKGYSLSNKFKNLLKLYKTKAWEEALVVFLGSRNSSLTVPEMHNKIFDFLCLWSDENKNSKNPFFYIRSKEDERFKKGYWFLGDEKYLAISFWAGGDSLNKTPNIYLSVNFNKSIAVYIVARDSENKKRYFSELALMLGYIPNREETLWSKYLDESIDDNFLNVIADFIKTDKIQIDNFIEETIDKPENSLKLLDDDYTSPFGFIDQEHFFKLRNRVESERNAEGVKKNIQLLGNEVMPVSLSRIEIQKFQGIESLSVNNLPANAKWIFITGENGFGKTSVLQGISLGLTNYLENSGYLHPGNKIIIGFNKNGEYFQNNILEIYNEDFNSLNNNFIAYGPLRLTTQATSSENQESRNSTSIYNLFNKDGLLKNFDYLIKNSFHKKDKGEFSNLKNVIIEILDSKISDILIDENNVVYYKEVDENGNILAQNKLEQLATGFQSLINLIGDIVTRFSVNFPKNKFDYYEGIILIDELENHLHPIIQKNIPSLLSKIFPKIQFVCSVHSPIPLLGALPNSLILNVNRNFEEGITLERIDQKFEMDTLNPNIILTSPIFGLNDIFPTSYSSQKRVDTSEDYDESVFRKKVKEKLDNFLNS